MRTRSAKHLAGSETELSRNSCAKWLRRSWPRSIRAGKARLLAHEFGVLVSTNWHWPRQAPGWRDALCRVLLSWRARRPSLQNIWTVAVALRATRTLRVAKRLQGWDSMFGVGCSMLLTLIAEERRDQRAFFRQERCCCQIARIAFCSVFPAVRVERDGTDRQWTNGRG